jgi:hypothetical protein
VFSPRSLLQPFGADGAILRELKKQRLRRSWRCHIDGSFAIPCERLRVCPMFQEKPNWFNVSGQSGLMQSRPPPSRLCIH